MRVLVALAATMLLFAGSPFVQQEQQWRAAYEYSLTAPEGWLSVAGLFWLHEGSNAAGSAAHADVRLPAGAPLHAGVFRLERGIITWLPAHGAAVRVEPDTSNRPTVIAIGDLSLTAIRRANKTGIRLRDPDAPSRRAFK